MGDLRTAPNADRFEVRTTADSHFSWVRTRLSVERTMMSWQRTAVAADWLWLCNSPVLQPPPTNPRSPPRLSSDRTGISEDGADSLRHPGSRHLALAVLLDGSLHVGRAVYGIAGMKKEGMQSPVVVVAILLIFIGLFAFSAV